jgi:aminoglycoside phosphotransferase (APT) family kinase protein
LPNQSRAQVLARLQGKVSRRVQAALPRHAEALARQCGQLARWSGEPAVVQAVLHGDLHTGNLLVTPAGHTVFIDLDSLTTGEPAYDLALLSTRLVLLALLNQAEPAQVDVLVARLPDWYEEAGGDPRAAAAYPWHVAALLTARQLKTCIRHAAPQLPHLAQALMALAGRVIDTGAVPHDLLGAAAGPDRRIGQAVQRSVVT